MSNKETLSAKNMAKHPGIKAWSADKTHECIIELLMMERRSGRVLDVAAGPGAMSYALCQRGFEVRACDIHPERFCVDGVRCDKIDINEGLSIYDSEMFDSVICGDVLEHIENHFFLVREISRVLKPGGRVIFSTPNIAHLQSRLFFLFTQHFPGFKAGDFPLGHINPVYPTFFTKILECSGFSCNFITYNRGWIYTSRAKGTLLKENGFEIPWKNRLFGQILIICAEKTTG